MAVPAVVHLEPSRVNSCIRARQPLGQNEESRKNLFRNVSAGPKYPGTVVFPPFSDQRLNYFEVKIVSKRSDRDFPEVGVGVGPTAYNLNWLPGWGINSVGYHSDDPSRGTLHHVCFKARCRGSFIPRTQAVDTSG